MTALNKNGRNTNEFVQWINKEFAIDFCKNLKELFFEGQKKGFESHAILAYLLADLSVSHTEFLIKSDIIDDKLGDRTQYPSFKVVYEEYQKYRDQNRPASANSNG